MTSERSTLARGRPVTTILEPATRARRGVAPAVRRGAVRRSLHGVTSHDFRPDIEGLRAVAVVVVVLFHLRIGLFSGGFVGVDVFFVLSGFLITRLLLTELSSTGGLALPNFWARRARRLLPASVLVLVVTVLAARWVMPPLAVRMVAADALAAATFVINFVFAHRMGDYFAEQAAAAQPSPLLHFWSLAVEEQFYLVWPLVLVAVARRPRQFRRLLAVVIGIGIAASLATSVWMTQHRPSWAFYLLPPRMGELLAGAALALAGPMFAAVPGRVRAALGWFGIVGISVAVFGYDSATPFPGTAAWLPVLATVLVIVAGGLAAPATGPARVLGNPVALWIGRHWYAIYLWHWPVLVLAEAHYGPLALPWRVLVVGGSVGLAAVSVRLVEDPVRHAPWLAVRPSRGLALGASLCSVALLAGVLAHRAMPRLDSGEAAAAPVLELAAPDPNTTSPESGPTTTVAAAAPTGSAQPASTGGTVPATTSVAAAPAGFASALAPGDIGTLLDANRQVLDAGLAVTDVPSNLRPSVGSVNGDRAAIYADDCVAIGVETELTPCTYGRTGAATTVVLYGDSHAAQWFPPLADLATERGFELVVLTKGGCPTAAVSIPTATLARTCPIWRDAAIDWIATNRPEVVLVSAWSGYPNSDEEWSAGFAATMSRLAPLTANLVVLGDNPPADVEPATCLSAHVHSVEQCTAERVDVVAQGRIDAERSVAGRYGARFIDTTDWLCADLACPIIIGDILLYRDATHLTTTATSWFEPLLAASLAGIL